MLASFWSSMCILLRSWLQFHSSHESIWRKFTSLYYSVFSHRSMAWVPVFSSAFMSLIVLALFFMSVQHISWFCSCFIFLMVLQRQSFPIIFPSCLLLLHKATGFLMFTSYLMILLNSHQFQYFFGWFSWGCFVYFFKTIFPENSNFSPSFPIGRDHSPHFCSGSHYIGFNFQKNVKSQVQFWSCSLDAPPSIPLLPNILVFPDIFCSTLLHELQHLLTPW